MRRIVLLGFYIHILIIVDYSLPLTCHEAQTGTTNPNNTNNSSPTPTSTTDLTISNKSLTTTSATDLTQIRNTSPPTPTSANGPDQIHTTEISTEGCVYVCPGDPQTTTSKIAVGNENPTVPITETLKIDKTKTGAYIRARTSAYDPRYSSKLIGLTGAAVICGICLIMVLIDATRFIKNGSMNKSARRKS